MFPDPCMVGDDGQLEPSRPLIPDAPQMADVTMSRWNALEGIAALLLLPALVGLFLAL